MKEHGVLLYPTDTVWGIGCDATDEAAVDRIFEVKERLPDKAFVSLVADLEQLNDYVEGDISPEIKELITTFERPLTVVFPKGKNVVRKVMPADGSIALRVVRDEFCQQVIRALGAPLVSTSANISGQPTAASYSEIEDAVLRRVDYVVNWRRLEAMGSKPSAIVKVLPQGGLEWLRE